MTKRHQKQPGVLSVTPPDLPGDGGEDSSFDGRFEPDEHYSDLTLADRDLTGQNAAHLTIRYARFRDVAMADTGLRFLRISDARFEHCDLANADWSQSALKRIEFVNCLMTGIRLIDSDLSDVVFEDCKIDLAQLRSSAFETCRFSNCNLREADFSEARLKDVAITGCDLRGSQIHGISLKKADFRGSSLEGLQAGIDDFRGGIIDSHQLLDLAYVLARLIGLKVLNDDAADSTTG